MARLAEAHPWRESTFCLPEQQLGRCHRTHRPRSVGRRCPDRRSGLRLLNLPATRGWPVTRAIFSFSGVLHHVGTITGSPDEGSDRPYPERPEDAAINKALYSSQGIDHIFTAEWKANTSFRHAASLWEGVSYSFLSFPGKGHRSTISFVSPVTPVSRCNPQSDNPLVTRVVVIPSISCRVDELRNDMRKRRQARLLHGPINYVFTMSPHINKQVRYDTNRIRGHRGDSAEPLHFSKLPHNR